MMHTIPHLVHMCHFPFVQRTLFVDTAPLSGDKVSRPHVGTMNQLRENCAQLLSAGVVDRVVDVDYSETYRKRVYHKHFGNSRIRQTHNYKGYPILGTIFSLEEVVGDYVLHFDSDMLLHQQPDFCWISQAISILQKHHDIVAIRPLAGPPGKDGFSQQVGDQHPDGFTRFKTFGSRVYLIDRQRFDRFLSIPVLWWSYEKKLLNRLPMRLRPLLNTLTNEGRLDSWEVMVSQRIQTSSYTRANLDFPQAWTLHPIDRSTAFLEALPAIIQRIEQGGYPPEQGGYYDLKFAAWQQVLVNL